MTQSNLDSQPPIVLAITGASGAIFATRLLQSLLCMNQKVHLTISESGAAVIRQELGVAIKLDGTLPLEELLAATDSMFLIDATEGEQTSTAIESSTKNLTYHHHKDYFTPIASGSFLTLGMVVCPCSGSTLSGIAHAASQNLIQRAAEVHMKERKKLILVPRETPLSTPYIENMLRISQAGATILPASPGWYHGVQELGDLVDFIVSRILDQLNIPNQLMKRWNHGFNDTSQ